MHNYLFKNKFKCRDAPKNELKWLSGCILAVLLGLFRPAFAADEALRSDCDKPDTAKVIVERFYSQRDKTLASLEAEQAGFRNTISAEADASPDRAEAFAEVRSSVDYLQLEAIKKQHEENYKALLQQLRLQLDDPRLNPKSKPACTSAMNALADLQRIGEIDKEQNKLLEKAAPYQPPPSEPPAKKKWPW